MEIRELGSMGCLGWSQDLPHASSAVSYTTHWLGFPHGSAEQTTDVVVTSSSEVPRRQALLHSHWLGYKL